MIQNAEIVGVNTPPEKYEVETEPRGSKDLVVRAHILSEILRNANRWVRGYQSPESKVLSYGSLLDCLLLTPTHYPRRYCSTPATYTNKKGELSKWRNDLRIAEVAAWHEEHEGLEVVSQDDLASVHGAIKRLREDNGIAELIDCSQHAVMITAEWLDKATGLIVPMKCLIDILPPADHPVYGSSIWDLKSTQNASPRSFMKDAQKFNYHIQAALYLDMFNAAEEDIRSDFGHVVQESYPPFEYRTPPPLMSQRFIGFGRICYQAALRIYCDGLMTGQWPSYDRKTKDWPKTDCEDYFLNMETIFQPMEEAEEEEEAPQEKNDDITP